MEKISCMEMESVVYVRVMESIEVSEMNSLLTSTLFMLQHQHRPKIQRNGSLSATNQNINSNAT